MKKKRLSASLAFPSVNQQADLLYKPNRQVRFVQTLQIQVFSAYLTESYLHCANSSGKEHKEFLSLVSTCLHSLASQVFCSTFAHFSYILATWGLTLPRQGLILPRIPPPTPILYSAVTHPFRGYARTQNTPNPTPKHPFSWAELQNGQNEPQSGQPGPHLGNMFEIFCMEKWIRPF